MQLKILRGFHILQIVMHLLATYMDTQLLPQPNKPDAKPFSGFHYIGANEKVTNVNENTLAIQEVSENPPHYRVIVGEETYEFVKVSFSN